MKIVLHFLSIQQWNETLAVLFETSPPSDSDERSEVEKEEGPLKVLGNGNSAFFFLNVNFYFTLTLFTLGRYRALRKTLFPFESSLPQYRSGSVQILWAPETPELSG